MFEPLLDTYEYPVDVDYTNTIALESESDLNDNKSMAFSVQHVSEHPEIDQGQGPAEDS